ncbi:hypothetical protein [Microvirga roseola]|uniref:hypothetical protein n=1 Tax=Microvirga roseola TaxID=2883126 RepID=UPI001E4711F9|nr:hypothetical protein [Microvirga roseola]
MSFDIHLIDATQSKSTAEVQRVLGEVLARHGARIVRKNVIEHVTPEGKTLKVAVEDIEGPNDLRIEWYGPSLERDVTSATAIPRDGSLKDTCRVIYDMAAHVPWIIAPTMEGEVFLQLIESRDIPIAYDDFPPVTIIENAEVLEAILSKGLDQWLGYRNRVLGIPQNK